MIEDFYQSVQIRDYEFTKASSAEYILNTFVKENWPIVYFIYNDEIKEAYVGESTNAFSRMNSHLSNSERTKLNKLTIIASDKFNKSATLDIESSFIKYISADGKYKLQNGNAGLSNHPYYQKSLYEILFQKLWIAFQEKRLAVNKLNDIDNSDLFKYSPYKSLSVDQNQSIIEIITLLYSKTNNSIFVEGGAGTGKTILAVFLMKLLVTESDEQTILDKEEGNITDELQHIKLLKSKFPNPKIALVIPMTSLRKTLKKVFKSIKSLSSGMVIGPSDVVKNKYDILIVDEAHRLRQRKNITNYASFDQANDKLGLDKNGTELDWICMQSDNQIFFYDEGQSIKPSDIDHSKFVNLKFNSSMLKLVSQHRVKGGTDYINFVDDLINIRLKENNFFNKTDYEFIVFDSLKEMYDQIKLKEAEFGLCRLLSGYSWEWKSKKNNVPDITIEGLDLKWNTTNEDWINSPNAINEVGCIHTTQGYDLNYSGIIIGTEVYLDPITQQIEVNSKNYYDSKGKDGIKNPLQLREYILNIYKTMMLRGIKGTYVYICDDLLREYFKKHVPFQ